MTKHRYFQGSKDELKQQLMKDKACAYYFSKDKAETSDIVLLPYIYLLNWKYNSFYLSFLKNAIVVIDEGHNLLSASCNGASVILTNAILEKAIKELTSLSKITSDQDFLIKRITLFCTSLQQFFDSPKFFKMFSYNKTYSLDKIFFIFAESLKLNIPFTSNLLDQITNDKEDFDFHKLKKLFEPLIEYFETKSFSEIIQLREKEKLGYVSIFGIKDLYKILKEIANIASKNLKIEESAQFSCQLKVESSQRGIKILSLDPNWTLSKILKNDPHSLIITSGTLSPFKYFEKEAKIEMPIQFSCSHVISSKSQVNKLIN